MWCPPGSPVQFNSASVCVLLLFMHHRRTHRVRQWTPLAPGQAAAAFICTVNSSALRALYPATVPLPSPVSFLPVCAHPVVSEAAFSSPVKLKQVLPFLKLFSEEPVVTCHLCLGGGCVVSPPCLFPTFFTKRSGGFGAHCGTSYLLLSFKHLGESGWCPSHHRAIFKK